MARVNDLEHELRKVVAGDVRFDPISRLLYSTDASMYQVEPIGVVIPRDADDVQAAVEVRGSTRWRSFRGVAGPRSPAIPSIAPSSWTSPGT